MRLALWIYRQWSDRDKNKGILENKREEDYGGECGMGYGVYNQ